ncbi:general secretion pathway protein D [Pectobacterium atrosepticum SCRI1043]|uniref:General secretion pathway protein D n=1 Tax=Pectobacterium atrosepticum (strain SCRI 1043 / ATCC BAA-672) TaxID=218491 RepID=Q6D2I6_PECAS|nr:type II secretion system secretin GspD [Pectobacterium atrosepticum]AIA71933.1 general secretion pathway protein GspD [Pectobacterium atrosepticum]KFX15011.1 general secretion pathway protein GspD [Pectobacterium atrosepticum]KFX23592.1 general secretion pathway protein GspD [Pectobacterium atrosepticum]MBL0892972.1 type II secretion system secretin GspD [Pectobacterium atrosepticum]MCA6977354.1 type II secretion system secretin GspD [Pectobacterium atrosepticum]
MLLLGGSILLMASSLAWSAEFSASFKGTDIQEFINTVSKNLNKTVIIDPSVSGTITVRSYDMMNEDQYYQFFLSVLDVYGFTVIPMDNNVLKIIRSKDAKSTSMPLASDEQPGIGDEVVTRVVPVNNVAARDLAPLLRQLNDNAGAGSVVHYEPSNVLLMTGRAGVIKRLMTIVERVDKTGDRNVTSIPLSYASSLEVVKMVNELNKMDEKSALPGMLTANVVADERTNSVLVRGEPNSRQRVIDMIKQLDRQQAVQGNTKVIYLKYAKATDLVEVLTGVGDSIQTDQQNALPALRKDISIKAHEQTNSLIVNAAPDIMRDLEQVIAQLDIRRPQVLVEAIIAEVQDADGMNLGVQWANKNAGVTQFTNTGLPITTMMAGADQFRRDGTLGTAATSALGSFNGIAAGFYQGNWSMLMTALSSNSKNDILATPSIVTLDNMEATFNVGQEVPVLAGSQTTSGDNVFQTVERKTVGIKLKVKPQINEGDSVLLEIEQEVSSVADAASSSSTNLGATFNTRTVNNAVLVSSGETVVVGGLLDKSTNESASKVPFLGDIPILGHLFRSNSQETKKRNLMLFIRPSIIRDRSQYQSASASKYHSFSNEEQKQRNVNSGDGGLLDNDLLRLPEGGNAYTFRQVQSSIVAFYPAGGK